MENTTHGIIEITIPDPKEVLEWLNTQNFAQVDGSLNALQKYFDQGKLSEKALVCAFELFSSDEFSLLNALKGWVQKYPDSYAALLAQGMFLVNEGHRRRGYASAQDVTPEQWNQMHACFEQSYRNLSRSLSLCNKPVLSYVALMNIEMVGGSSAKLDKIPMFYQSALELYPASFEARLMRLRTLRAEWGGGDLYAMKKFLQSEEHGVLNHDQLQRLTASFHFYSAHWLSHFKDDYSIALREYSKAIEIDSKLFKGDMYYGRAVSYNQLGYDQEAVTDLEAAMEINPKSDMNYYLAGWILLYKLKQKDKGKKYLEMASRLGNTHAWEMLKGQDNNFMSVMREYYRQRPGIMISIGLFILYMISTIFRIPGLIK
jgi:tetratricopeptide (TPR) repeat protein